MRIDRVVLLNWMRFTGETTVDLGPEVYGVVAEHESDRRRSNWCGKTAFAEAVRFALYGVHRFGREDGWITHGEAGGSVALMLSDGTVVTRSRVRGRATKLVVTRGEEGATGEAAQEVLDRLVGLTRDDFEVTCWFGQKQLARLVLARPVERFDLVSGWFGLGGLQRCEERVRGTLAGLASQIAAEQARRALLEQQRLQFIENWRPALGSAPDSDALVAESVRRGSVVDEALSALARAEAEAARYREQERAAEAAAEMAALRERGRVLAAEASELAREGNRLAPLRAEHDKAKVALAEAAADLKAKRTLATGKFSGTCPVDSHACPVRQEINERTAHNAELYDAAQAEYEQRSRVEAGVRAAVADAETSARKALTLQARVEEMRARARELLPLAKAAVELDESEQLARRDELSACHEAVARAREARLAIDRARQEWRELVARIEACDLTLAELGERERVARAALRIFGRQGAQRRLAEAALVEIEAGANGILREAGIGLSLSVQWAREGQGLAAWCGECGAPFPPSARVKACERCRAERGPKVVERLDVELSDRSGAAEDLAGAALQLAAAAWLRRERGVGWSVAFIDEPFGALDEAHRRSFASQLLSMLRGSAGFEQAFIIAHHPDVLDGLPGQLVVRAGESASTVVVR